MTKPSLSLSTLLERIESEIETADGRTVRLCRDENGNYWVVDGAERVVSLNEFAAECRDAARTLCARERGVMLRQFVASAKQTIARAAAALRPGTPTAHA